MAFRHIEHGVAPSHTARVPHRRWACQMLFEEATDAIIRICSEIMKSACPEIRKMAACFLLDQAKAFEFLHHKWIRQVLNAWRLPAWLGAFLLVMTEERKLIGNPLPTRPGRRLCRGVGMGGPSSMFTWVLRFDPISMDRQNGRPLRQQAFCGRLAWTNFRTRANPPSIYRFIGLHEKSWSQGGRPPLCLRPWPETCRGCPTPPRFSCYPPTTQQRRLLHI